MTIDRRCRGFASCASMSLPVVTKLTRSKKWWGFPSSRATSAGVCLCKRQISGVGGTIGRPGARPWGYASPMPFSLTVRWYSLPILSISLGACRQRNIFYYGFMREDRCEGSSFYYQASLIKYSSEVNLNLAAWVSPDSSIQSRQTKRSVENAQEGLKRKNSASNVILLLRNPSQWSA